MKNKVTEEAVSERLLIATRNKLILWDGIPHIILENRMPDKYHDFYGITWDHENIYVSERLLRNHCLIHIFDNKLNHKGTVPLGVSIGDVHQIFWYDEILYITNTQRNQILLWGGRSARAVEWKKPDEPHLHLNSIWCDGEKFYVAEHRKKEIPKRIRVLDLDFKPIGCIELKGDFIKDQPDGIHNVYIENKMLYTCSPQALVRHGLVSGLSEPIVPHRLMDDSHYVRGLARVAGKFFIGLSETKVRTERNRGDSIVLVTNDDFNILDVLLFKDTGSIHEIRAVDSPDLAHNKVMCPLLSNLHI